MQSGNLGIQATDEAINTKTNQQSPAIMGGSRKGGAAKTQHTQSHTPHRRSEERSQEAAEDRVRKDTHAPEGGRTCLSGVQKGAKDHTMMNTSVREHTAPQQHRKHGVEGKIPTQGQMAFGAMRHNEEGRQCATNTPRTEARQPGRRRKQRYPEGGTSKTWAKAPKRTIRGGGRATSGREQPTKTEPGKTRHQHLL